MKEFWVFFFSQNVYTNAFLITLCTYRYLDRGNGTVDFDNCDDVGFDVEYDMVENRMVADQMVHILVQIELVVQMVENGLVHYVEISYYDAHDLDEIFHAYCAIIVWVNDHLHLESHQTPIKLIN